MEPINNIKKCSGIVNSSKNKLNNKISWLFNLEPKADKISLLLPLKTSTHIKIFISHVSSHKTLSLSLSLSHTHTHAPPSLTQHCRPTQTSHLPPLSQGQPSIVSMPSLGLPSGGAVSTSLPPCLDLHRQPLFSSPSQSPYLLSHFPPPSLPFYSSPLSPFPFRLCFDTVCQGLSLGDMFLAKCYARYNIYSKAHHGKLVHFTTSIVYLNLNIQFQSNRFWNVTISFNF